MDTPFFQPALHFSPDLFKPFLCPGLKARHQNRLRIGRPYECPTILEKNPGTINPDYFVPAPKMLDGSIDNPPLHLLGHLDPNLRGRDISGKGIGLVSKRLIKPGYQGY